MACDNRIRARQFQGTIFLTWINLIPTWISEHMSNKVCGDSCNYFSMLGIKLIHVNKGDTGGRG